MASALKLITHSKPWVGEKEAKAAAHVILSGHLAQGEKARELEQMWCKITQTKYAAAVGSGLGALRLSLLAVGVRKGDQVIVPAYSCVALFNAVLAVGATPVLADVLPDQWTLSPEDVKKKVNEKTKAIVAVHLFGSPARVEELSSLGVPIIEDCAHGIGRLKNGKPFGSFGALSISSFYPTKMIAGGEGGIVSGNNKKIIRWIKRARNYGDQAPSPYLLNDKMTDMEAAIAIEQLKKYKTLIQKRKALAQSYREKLLPLEEAGKLLLPEDAEGRVWYRFPVRLTRSKAKAVGQKMRQKGVAAEQPVWNYRKAYPLPENCRMTSLAFDHLLSLPLYPALTLSEQKRIVATLKESL